jgi:uncharacterized protein with HEPN domain
MPRDFRLYLDDMLGAIGRIQEYTADMDEAAFALDSKTQDAVVRNLEVIGEAARNLPDQMKAGAPEIDWRKIVGLRNILIHEYFGISTPILWDVVQSKLGPLETVCRKLLEKAAEPDDKEVV